MDADIAVMVEARMLSTRLAGEVADLLLASTVDEQQASDALAIAGSLIQRRAFRQNQERVVSQVEQLRADYELPPLPL